MTDSSSTATVAAPHVTGAAAHASSSALARNFSLADFDFALPPELIAQAPASERSGSRLLDGTGDVPIDRMFRDLPQLLRAGDLLVFNDTRVIKARLLGVKATGGSVEALVERVLPNLEVLAHLRASKSPKAGSRVRFAGAFDAEVLGRAGPQDAMFQLRFPSDPFALLEAHGHVPLPPYITHADTADDESRYQTVFAAKPGAVAAPTAALHFDRALLDQLVERGVASANVTLHVGAGTFQPVRTENLAEHAMHSEWFDVPETTVGAIDRTRANGGRIVAVGTTTLRALESAARFDVAHDEGDAVAGTLRNDASRGSESHPKIASGSRETDIFITPGFEFRVVDVLITNFHLPKSTLLMLVSAFAGFDHIHALYRHAIEQRFRFFSYGDAMLLERSA